MLDLFAHNRTAYDAAVRLLASVECLSSAAENADFVVARGGEDVLDLYAHNRATHESAVRSLAETGKAAAVHPIGKRHIYLDNQCNLADELLDGCRLRNTPGRSHRPGHFACPEVYDYGAPLYNQDPTQREKLRTLFAQNREPGA